MTRDRSVQGPPPPSLTDFPSAPLPEGMRWHRCHRAEHGPWYHASHAPGDVGAGRWDLPEPHGTCYLAETAPAALRESAGPDLLELGFLTRPWTDQRVVSEIALAATVTVADLRSTEASCLGATAELTGALPYRTTQAWALAWHGAGFAGVVFGMRFAMNHAGLGLFGAAGPVDPPPPVHGVVTAAQAADAAGLRVLDVPTSRSMTVVEPPPTQD